MIITSKCITNLYYNLSKDDRITYYNQLPFYDLSINDIIHRLYMSDGSTVIEDFYRPRDYEVKCSSIKKGAIRNK